MIYAILDRELPHAVLQSRKRLLVYRVAGNVIVIYIAISGHPLLYRCTGPVMWPIASSNTLKSLVSWLLRIRSRMRDGLRRMLSNLHVALTTEPMGVTKEDLECKRQRRELYTEEQICRSWVIVNNFGYIFIEFFL